MAESQRRRAHKAGEQGRELPQTLRDAAEDDPGIIDAYDAGHSGRSWEHYVNGDPEPAPAPASETEPESEPEPAPAPAPVSSPAPARLSKSATDTGGGVFLGAIAYALLLSLINYGASGPKDWLRAKFLNKPTPVPGTGGATSSAAPGVAKAVLQ